MNTAILVIDLINDIISPKGKIATCANQVAERQVIQKANIAMQFARDHQWLVIPIKVGFSEQYFEQPKNSPIFGKAQQLQALTLGQWGTEFQDDLNITANDYMLVKHRISPFYATSLDLILRNKGTTRLLICGVSSTWAVQSAAREGHDRDYEIIIIEDACAAASAEEHQLSMQQLSRIAKIITTNQLATLISV